ncbi:MAG: hypothetical protein ACI9HX_001189 [Pseudoalteromonas tetraodonis]|jgi:uncharacterized protein with von Willebrand factor type A (vWA) domain
MQQALGNFIQALRDEGLPVSPAETLDALDTVKLVGVQSPAQLQQALGLVLAKSEPHKRQFNQTFQRFFFPSSSENKQQQSQAKEQDHRASEQSPQEPLAEAESELGQQLLNKQQAQLQADIVANAAAAGVTQMEIFTQKPMVTYRIMKALGDEGLRDELIALEASGDNPQLLQALEQGRQQLRESVADYVEQQFLLYSEARGRKLQDDTLEKISLTAIDQTNQAAMIRLVRKAAKRLASLHSRRRKVTRRGLLDVRKTVAANAAFDGILFHTKWKQTRIDRPKVVVICDISGSVSAVARFLLLFLYSLQDVLPRVRSFVFTSDLIEVTDQLASLEIEEALALIMANMANGSTDYGVAMRDLRSDVLKDIDNKTTVIMLGDARNNDGNSEAQIWRQVYRQAKRVIWLNPETKGRWNSGDSVMSEYAPYCSRVESANSLRDLSRVLDSALKQV